MSQREEADAAFKRIINQGRTASIRKSAEAYWAAYTSEAGADKAVGKKFEDAIKGIPLDYRQPTVKYLEDLNSCKESNPDDATCYLAFAIAIVDRIVSL